MFRVSNSPRSPMQIVPNLTPCDISSFSRRRSIQFGGALRPLSLCHTFPFMIFCHFGIRMLATQMRRSIGHMPLGQKDIRGDSEPHLPSLMAQKSIYSKTTFPVIQISSRTTKTMGATTVFQKQDKKIKSTLEWINCWNCKSVTWRGCSCWQCEQWND